MKPYVVLAKNYRPHEFSTPKTIGESLTAITAGLGLVPHVDPAHGPIKLKRAWYSEELHAEVRSKTSNATSAEGWHYDGDTTPGANPDCCLVLWSNKAPTEIMYKGRIYRPEPYELVIFKNRSVTHRRPLNAPKERWVFRQRVAIPAHIKLP